jgi:nitroreductase
MRSLVTRQNIDVEVSLPVVADSTLRTMHCQRACRRFSDDPVDDHTLASIFDAATKAPSSENLQPWVFVVVRGAEQRRSIGEHLRQAWVSGGLEYVRGRLPDSLVAAIDDGQMRGIAEAPVLVVVGGDTRRVPKRWLASSIFPAVQNLLLAANAVGLGSALTTLAAADGRSLGETVGFPEEVLPMAMIPLGYPARPLGPPRREPFEQHTFRDQYGVPW